MASEHQSTTQPSRTPQSRKPASGSAARVNGKRKHVSTYLKPETLTQLEKIRSDAYLESEGERRISRADLIERAVELALKNPGDLLQQV